MSSIQARALLSPAGLLVAGGPAIRAASADLGGLVFGVYSLGRTGDDAHLYATAYWGHFTVAGFTTANPPDRPRPRPCLFGCSPACQPLGHTPPAIAVLHGNRYPGEQESV